MGPKKAILLGNKYVCKASDQKSCQMQQTPVSWTNNLLVLYDAIGKDNDDDDDNDYDDDFFLILKIVIEMIKIKEVKQFQNISYIFLFLNWLPCPTAEHFHPDIK